jgi:hypothetical protein
MGRNMKKRSILIGSAIVASAAVTGVLIAYAFTRKPASASLCPGGCACCDGCRSVAALESSYYSGRQGALLKVLRKQQTFFRRALSTSYDEATIDAISEETEARFIRIIPTLPYIGGAENDRTEDIETTGMALAFYETMKGRGVPTAEIGRLIVAATEGGLSSVPRWLLHLSGARYFTSGHIARSKRNAERSQERNYPGDWVTIFVAGDGSAFDYGCDHLECGVEKFLAANGAADLTPYLCSLDFLYSDYLGEGLIRSGTLAEGRDRCDFRFKRK